MNALTTVLDHMSPGGAYAIVALAILAESVLLVGAFVPTLTLLLTAGALARTGQLSLPLLIATAAPAVIAGDFLAYRTGRALGPSLRTGRLGRRLPAAAWRRTETLMARCGGHAVFLARFLPVMRSLVPHLAGATCLPYHRIAPTASPPPRCGPPSKWAPDTRPPRPSSTRSPSVGPSSPLPPQPSRQQHSYGSVIAGHASLRRPPSRQVTLPILINDHR
ncbi:DedA family protein [Streptomyces sp. NPDC090135]|uniref:DedA family protein n=1 Tax=Streptomyces sp. NPDC090135 TaxID=3365957 RepID=UPI00382D469B